MSTQDILKIKNGEYTDEQRAKVLAGDYSTEFGGVNVNGLLEDFRNYANKAERKAFEDHQTDWYSAMQTYLLNRDIDLPLLHDLRGRHSMAAVSHVNAGANDFNSSNGGVCPSVAAADYFGDLMYALTKPQVSGNAEKLKKYQNEINDILYVYRKLKEHKRIEGVIELGNNGPAKGKIKERVVEEGLNKKVIEAYEKRNPQEKISETLEGIRQWQLKNQLLL